MSSISTTVDAGWFESVVMSALFDTSRLVAAQLGNDFRENILSYM